MIDRYNAGQSLLPGNHPKAFSHSGVSRYWVEMALGEAFVLDVQNGNTLSLLIEGLPSDVTVEISNHDYRQPDASKTNTYAQNASDQYVQPNPDAVWEALGSPNAAWTKLDIAGVSQVRIAASGAVKVHCEVTAAKASFTGWVSAASTGATRYTIQERKRCDYDALKHANTWFDERVAIDQTGAEILLTQTKDGQPYVPQGFVKPCPEKIGSEMYTDISQSNFHLRHDMHIIVTSQVQNPDLSWTFDVEAVQQVLGAAGFGSFVVIDRNAVAPAVFVSTGFLTGQVTVLPGQDMLLSLNHFSLTGTSHVSQAKIEVLPDGTLQAYFPRPQIKGDGLNGVYVYDATAYPTVKPDFFSWEPYMLANPSSITIGGTPATYTPIRSGVTHNYGPLLGPIKTGFFFGEDWRGGPWEYEIRHEASIELV